MTDPWTNRLSDYVDGDLEEPERTELEAHLHGCVECRTLVDHLRMVQQRARELEDLPPDSDLWQGIAERIRGIRPGESQVVDLDARRARRVRRFQFTVPQLVAASVALMAVSAGGVWLSKPSASPTTAAVPTDVIDSSTAVAVLAGFDTGEYDTAVEGLERILRENRERLDPSTVAALERSLATIDRAIREAHEALRSDPTNTYLSAHLAATMNQKIKLLQQAAALTTAAS